ncbi:MAG: [FeFe] hydrogenase H-cluster radical SAM maturase HydG [Spirochaetes bacterium GWB1_48_6]|nr:MAG: [FeFe] hydrogenase H-cluster radical SAM maturase HydG [Spirochaetes bacterium GWB1_48_6]
MPVIAKTSFIDVPTLKNLIKGSVPSDSEVKTLLEKARKLKGLSLEEASILLRIESTTQLQELLETAGYVKEEIYGRRLVIFAPLYTGNTCTNNCLYCAFRQDNETLTRVTLTQKQIEKETRALIQDGHKRLLMLCGESADIPLDYFLESIRTVYGVKEGRSGIKRINVEIAPLDVEGFRRLKEEKIGTYICFQETYDPVVYAQAHVSGQKADYLWRLEVMDRAMEAGIEDVGIGALFGLGDWKFELLGLLSHARHLETKFGCGPHTVSVPRLEPADNAPLSQVVPHPVSDQDFKKIVAILRITLPYAGIILSTRENEELRTDLFRYGISQISAGSRTDPGAYAREDGEVAAGGQFSLGDHRSLHEVISSLIDEEYVPSFCTGCYRKGRIGADFMDLAKPGLIKKFCLPNGLFSFKEYLLDFAPEEIREKGLKLIEKMVKIIPEEKVKARAVKGLAEVEGGGRDVYY